MKLLWIWVLRKAEKWLFVTYNWHRMSCFSESSLCVKLMRNATSFNPFECAASCSHIACWSKDTRRRIKCFSLKFRNKFHQRNIIKLITHIWFPSDICFLAGLVYIRGFKKGSCFHLKETQSIKNSQKFLTVNVKAACVFAKTKIIVNSTEN